MANLGFVAGSCVCTTGTLIRSLGGLEKSLLCCHSGWLVMPSSKNRKSITAVPDSVMSPGIRGGTESVDMRLASM